MDAGLMFFFQYMKNIVNFFLIVSAEKSTAIQVCFPYMQGVILIWLFPRFLLHLRFSEL